MSNCGFNVESEHQEDDLETLRTFPVLRAICKKKKKRKKILKQEKDAYQKCHWTCCWSFAASIRYCRSPDRPIGRDTVDFSSSPHLREQSSADHVFMFHRFQRSLFSFSSERLNEPRCTCFLTDDDHDVWFWSVSCLSKLLHCTCLTHHDALWCLFRLQKEGKDESQEINSTPFYPSVLFLSLMLSYVLFQCVYCMFQQWQYYPSPLGDGSVCLVLENFYIYVSYFLYFFMVIYYTM